MKKVANIILLSVVMAITLSCEYSGLTCQKCHLWTPQPPPNDPKIDALYKKFKGKWRITGFWINDKDAMDTIIQYKLNYPFDFTYDGYQYTEDGSTRVHKININYPIDLDSNRFFKEFEYNLWGDTIIFRSYPYYDNPYYTSNEIFHKIDSMYLFGSDDNIKQKCKFYKYVFENDKKVVFKLMQFCKRDFDIKIEFLKY